MGLISPARTGNTAYVWWNLMTVGFLGIKGEKKGSKTWGFRPRPVMHPIHLLVKIFRQSYQQCRRANPAALQRCKDCTIFRILWLWDDEQQISLKKTDSNLERLLIHASSTIIGAIRAEMCNSEWTWPTQDAIPCIGELLYDAYYDVWKFGWDIVST